MYDLDAACSCSAVLGLYYALYLSDLNLMKCLMGTSLIGHHLAYCFSLKSYMKRVEYPIDTNEEDEIVLPLFLLPPFLV